MDGFGHDVAQKIKAAIKAKLVEIDAYVDDELPDYIMVMVANKKSKKAMSEDLNLFLGDNTHKFTDWLNEVLEKLQSVTLEGNMCLQKSSESKLGLGNNFAHGQSETVSTSQTVTNTLPKVEQVADVSFKLTVPETVDLPDEFLAIKAEQDADDILGEELKDEVAAVTASVPVADARSTAAVQFRNPEPLGPKPPPTSHQQPTATLQVIRPRTLLVKSEKENCATQPLNLTTNSRTNGVKVPLVSGSTSKTRQAAEHRLSHELTRKRKLPSSMVGAVLQRPFPQDEDESEYNPRHPIIGTVASVVQVTQRKSSVPPERQATKTLLLKAVDEAHKSVLQSVKSRTETSDGVWLEDGQRPRLFTKNYLSAMKKDSVKASPVRSPKAISVSEPPSATPISTKGVRLKVESESPRPAAPQPSDEVNREAELDASVAEQGGVENETLDCSLGPEVDDDDEEVAMQTSSVERAASPKFIITLDGVNAEKMFSSHFGNSETFYGEEALDIAVADDDCDFELQPVDEMASESNQEFVASASQSKEDEDAWFVDLEGDASGEVARKRQKLMERCRFWPLCRNGEDCPYQHPTVLCKAFPNCKFGIHCLYVHPNCKFDTACTRRDCPFTHSSKTIGVEAMQRDGQAGGVASHMPPAFVQPRSFQKLLSSSSPAQVGSSLASRSQKVRCRKFPNCSNLSCPFLHPKPCRYGIGCTRNDCIYSHPPLPKRDQLKWTSEQPSMAAAHVSQRQFAFVNVEEQILTTVET